METDLYPNQAVRFTNPVEYSYQSADVDISIMVYSGHPKNTTISDLLPNYELFMNDPVQKGDVRLVSSNLTNIAGQDALNHVYYDYTSNNNLKVNEVVIVKNGEFLINYSTQPGQFNTYLPDFKKMLDSFEVTQFTPTNNTLLFEPGYSSPSLSQSQDIQPYTPFPNFKLPPQPEFKLPDLPNFNIPGLIVN